MKLSDLKKAIKNLVHIHVHNKPILSNYVSFGSRDVIFECRCGHRVLIHEYRNFGEPFTMNWTCGLNSKQMQQVLDGEEDEYLKNHISIMRQSRMPMDQDYEDYLEQEADRQLSMMKDRGEI